MARIWKSFWLLFSQIFVSILLGCPFWFFQTDKYIRFLLRTLSSLRLSFLFFCWGLADANNVNLMKDQANTKHELLLFNFIYPSVFHIFLFPLFFFLEQHTNKQKSSWKIISSFQINNNLQMLAFSRPLFCCCTVLFLLLRYTYLHRNPFLIHCKAFKY